MSELICYCFQYTDEDIKQNFEVNNGRSTILEKIAIAKRNGTCDCDNKHPQKR